MNSDGCNQLRIASYENMILNHSLMLADAVVIAGDRPSSDIDSFANARIA